MTWVDYLCPWRQERIEARKEQTALFREALLLLQEQQKFMREWLSMMQAPGVISDSPKSTPADDILEQLEQQAEMGDASSRELLADAEALRRYLDAFC